MRTVPTTSFIPPCDHWSISIDGRECSTCALNLLNLGQLTLHCRSVTAKNRAAPCNHWTISQDCWKGIWSALKLLHISELMLDCRAVPPAGSISPCDHRSICQDRSECTIRGLKRSNIFELILDSVAVTTRFSIAPSNHWAVGQNRSKGPLCRLDVLHIPQQFADWAIAASLGRAPGNHRSICNGSKCFGSGLKLLDILQLLGLFFVVNRYMMQFLFFFVILANFLAPSSKGNVGYFMALVYIRIRFLLSPLCVLSLSLLSLWLWLVSYQMIVMNHYEYVYTRKFPKH